MKTSIVIMGLSLLANNASATIRDVEPLAQCTGLVRSPLSTSEPSPQIFTSPRGTIPERVYLLVLRPTAQIYEIAPPQTWNTGTYQSTMSWVKVPGVTPERYVYLTYDGDHNFRHSAVNASRPLDLSKWLEARRLRDVMVANGVNQNERRSGIGTFLIQLSDRTGFMPGENLMPGETLKDAIERFRNGDSDTYSQAEAIRFQTENRQFFTDCVGGRICRTSVGTESAALVPPERERLLEDWEQVFHSDLRRFLASCPARPSHVGTEQSSSDAEIGR